MNTKALDWSGGMRTETAVETLSVADTLLIHTANSSYSFSLIDPLRGFGILTGGVFGDCLVRATLIGVVRGSAETSEGSLERLVAGARAIFLIASSKSVRRVRTSPIKNVVQLDKGAR